jgi:hypothetical protein
MGSHRGAVTTGQQLRITSDLAPSAARTKRATGKRAVATKPAVSTKATTVSTKAKTKSVKPAVKNGAGAPSAKANATAGG